MQAKQIKPPAGGLPPKAIVRDVYQCDPRQLGEQARLSYDRVIHARRPPLVEMLRRAAARIAGSD